MLAPWRWPRRLSASIPTITCTGIHSDWHILANGGSTGAVAALHRAITLGSEENPFNHVFLAMAHARLGDRQQAQHSLAQAMLLREQDYLNHRELTCFCDEARAVVGTEPQAAPADT